MKTLRTYPAILLATLFLATSAVAQTKTRKPMSRTTKGGLIGVAAGGVIGGVVGKKVGNTAAGVIIGATVGGAAGAIIGRRMDK